MAGQGGHPELAAQPARPYGAAAAAATADRRAWTVCAARHTRRRHARQRAGRIRADDRAHRSGADRLAGRRRAHGAGARLFRRPRAFGREAAAARPQQRSAGRGHHRCGRRRALRRLAAAWRRAAGAGRAGRVRAGRRPVRARPERGGVRSIGSRGGRAAASGAARYVPVSRSRHLPAGRDGAGDGADPRRCRPAGRSAGAPDGAASKRAGLPARQPAARAGRCDPLAGHALGGSGARHLDHRGAGRSERTRDRAHQLSRGRLRAGPDGGLVRHAAAGPGGGAAIRSAGDRALPVWSTSRRPVRPCAGGADTRSGAVPSASRLSHRAGGRGLCAGQAAGRSAADRCAGPHRLQR